MPQTHLVLRSMQPRSSMLRAPTGKKPPASPSSFGAPWMRILPLKWWMRSFGASYSMSPCIAPTSGATSAHCVAAAAAPAPAPAPPLAPPLSPPPPPPALLAAAAEGPMASLSLRFVSPSMLLVST